MLVFEAALLVTAMAPPTTPVPSSPPRRPTCGTPAGVDARSPVADCCINLARLFARHLPPSIPTHSAPPDAANVRTEADDATH